jgi:hypothetical protein
MESSSSHTMSLAEKSFKDVRKSEAPRPKERGFPARWIAKIVPLDPGLKAGASGARSVKKRH